MPEFDPIPQASESVAAAIIDAAMHVHMTLGPGLLESVYEACLCHDLHKRGVSFVRQLELPILYDNIRLESGLRIDILAADCVIVELKSVETILPVHEAQLLTYLKLSNKRLGLLLNFNVPLMKHGIKRMVL